MPKSTQTRKDKSDGKYTKPHPSLHLFTKDQRCRDEALYIYHHLSFLVCVLFGTPFLHLFSFLMIFLSCFCAFLAMFSFTLWSKHYFNHNPIPFKTVLTGEYVANCSVKSKHATTYRQYGSQISCCLQHGVCVVNSVVYRPQAWDQPETGYFYKFMYRLVLALHVV